ncbi:DUF167 family protein [Rhodovulum sp. DZ06]|uniref:DUF167 family protein n=1 Tax=Rhodovulum sp. DZ06 TaxID=3425126 RepID=UPI003D33D594
MAEDAPWEEIPGGLRLHLRLTPKGGADRIDGIAADADGRAHLAARVSAPPDKGKANAALEKLVAKALGVPKRDVALVRGQTSRVKALEVAGDPKALVAALRAATGA